MNKTELIEMLREYISAAKNPTSSVHLVVLSLPEATDLLRELEDDDAPICKCGNKKVLQYACEQCDY